MTATHRHIEQAHQVVNGFQNPTEEEIVASVNDPKKYFHLHVLGGHVSPVHFVSIAPPDGSKLHRRPYVAVTADKKMVEGVLAFQHGEVVSGTYMLMV